MKLGPFSINYSIAERGFEPNGYENVDAEFDALKKGGKKLLLGVFPARSGARWLCDIFSAHDNAIGTLERYATPEALWRYIKYNKLPIDTAGIVRLIKCGIVADWKKKDTSLIFSPYFSHGLLELVGALKPDTVIFALNDPRHTVQSLYNKGFFKETYFRDDENLALGYQPNIEKMHWLFGRVVPNGAYYREWLALTRVGKIAWWGNMLVRDIYEQFTQLPQECTWIFDLRKADQNYEYYKEMAKRFGLEPLLPERTFLAMKGKTVQAKDNTPHEWSSQEEKEFTELTGEWYRLYSSLTA